MKAQLVQITDFHSDTPTRDTNTDDLLDFPMDMEIDNSGRIWVGYEWGEIGLKVRESISIDGVAIQSTAATSLVFDRRNNYMYYIDGATINRIQTLFDINDLTFPTPEQIDTTTLDIGTITPFGLAVDDEGYIYFTGEVITVEQNLQWYIYKIHPDSPDTVVASTTEIATNPDAFNSYDYPDLLYKEGHIFVTNKAGTSEDQILKLNKDLELVDSFGVAATEFTGTTAEGEFFGPSRFLASTNKKIYVIDEDSGGTTFNGNRIVSFDTDFGGWDTYMPQGVDPQGVETDIFSFYYGMQLLY